MRWDDALSTGDAAIDAQHQQLLGIFDDIESAVEHDMGHDKVGSILQRLEDYIAVHFAAEERLMITSGYPAVSDHAAEHERLAEKTRSLAMAHRLGVESAVPLTLLLRDWVFDHIRESDREFALYLTGSDGDARRRGGPLRPT